MIFVDTGAWYSSEVEDDAHHLKTRNFMKNELASNTFGVLVTSDYVLDETITLLRTRRGLKSATDFINKIRNSKSLRTVWIGSEVFDSAVRELSKYNDKGDHDLSFTDCTSFSIMKLLSITNAFTLDIHFQRHGFNVLP